MVVRAFLFETRGGALIDQIEPAAYEWDETANQADHVRLVMNLNDEPEASRDWRSSGAAWKHSIALDVNGRLIGGPILPHDFDDPKGTVEITARGLRTAFAEGRRSILPLAAMPPRALTLPNGNPDTSLDSTWTGYDLGTIAKKIGVQACAWPGWTDVPIVWPADRAGASERTYQAIEKKNVDDAWTDLSNVRRGPDIRLRLAWDGTDRFQWFFETGTEQQPRLQGTEVFEWEIGRTSGLNVKTNPTMMGSLAWSQGGRSDDTVLVRGMYDPTLVDHGYPLFEINTDASTNIVDVETLDSWNFEALRTGAKPWEFWSFEVPADEQPFPYEYGPGSLVKVIVTPQSKVAGGYVPPGTYTRRIAQLSGKVGDFITITCGEAYDS